MFNEYQISYMKSLAAFDLLNALGHVHNPCGEITLEDREGV